MVGNLFIRDNRVYIFRYYIINDVLFVLVYVFEVSNTQNSFILGRSPMLGHEV